FRRAHQTAGGSTRAGRLRGRAMQDDVKGEQPKQARAAATSTVLVIDDDPALLHSLTTVFEAHGIAIATARDGMAGIAAFRRLAPAVVLTDILMPEQDGIGTIMAMHRERPDAKIIAMSGGGRVGKSDFLDIAKRLGADMVIHKPFDVDELVAAVRRYLKPPSV